MYQVFDNDKPCDSNHFPILKDKYWSNSKFHTFEEAMAYANNWLGAYTGDCLEIFKLNRPLDYSGYGDMIEIRWIDD